MKTRIDISKLQPQAFKAMYALESYLAGSSLPASLKELIKLRVSQLNGCAFCLDMHSKDALKHGETVQRIVLLDAWEESGLFSREEAAALKLAEEVTRIGEGGVSEAAYHAAEAAFGEIGVAELIMAAVTINAWNRIAIATRLAIPA
jgi:AhpD family alkylhydroperoxidase